MPPAGRLGDKAHADLDAHGCPACPHSPTGPAIQGSPDICINGKPALRVGDPGNHAPCCGPNTWTAQKGATKVLLNGKPAYRKDDPSQHCGGSGRLIEGSPNVIIGDSPAKGKLNNRGGAAKAETSGASAGTAPSAQHHAEAAPQPAAQHFLEIVLLDEEDRPVPGAAYEVTLPSGELRRGKLDGDGRARISGFAPGPCQVGFPDLDQDAWDYIGEEAT